MKFIRVLNSKTALFSALALIASALGSQAVAQDEEEVIEEVIVTGSLRSLPTERKEI